MADLQQLKCTSCGGTLRPVSGGILECQFCHNTYHLQNATPPLIVKENQVDNQTNDEDEEESATSDTSGGGCGCLVLLLLIIAIAWAAITGSGWVTYAIIITICMLLGVLASIADSVEVTTDSEENEDENEETE